MFGDNYVDYFSKKNDSQVMPCSHLNGHLVLLTIA